MADFNRDLPETINHPDIAHYLAVCEEITDQGIMSVSAFNSVLYIPFLPTSIILKWKQAKQDFRYVYWGKVLTAVYGLELTGKYIADGQHADTENPFILAHLESMQKKRNIYLGGTIDWRAKKYRTWNQVILPFERDGTVSETLTFVTFD